MQVLVIILHILKSEISQ